MFSKVDNNSVLFFYHIPKTAGQSLRTEFTNKFGLNTGFVHLGPYGEKNRLESKQKFISQFNGKEKSAIKIIGGHYIDETYERYFKHREIKKFTILRDPIERLISQYNHYIRLAGADHPIDFMSWYQKGFDQELVWRYLPGHKLNKQDQLSTLKSVGHNYVAKFILHSHGVMNYQGLTNDQLFEKTKSILETFWHVGSVESISQSILLISNETNTDIHILHANKAQYDRSEVTEIDDEYLRKKNQVDYALFERFSSQ